MQKFTVAQRIGWGIMLLLSLFIVLVASRYLTFNPDVYFPEQRAVYIAQRTAIYTHIIGGLLALLLGPFQFLPRLRVKRPSVHRWVGRIYMFGILIGSIGGFYMAFYAYAGIAASLGFGLLAILWFSTAFMALKTIRTKDVAAHQAWMIRNFSLTFAAVMLRIWMAPLIGVFGPETGYEIVAWACWVPNLFVAEALVQGWFKRSSPAEFTPTAETR